jgi:molybdopterin molybdotransferase
MEAAAIMTGAALPKGADAVVMIEKTEALPDSKVLIHEGVKSGENVAPESSEVNKGDVVMRQGCLIGPAQIGVLATFGKTEVEVQVAPSVGIIPTGSEVVEVEAVPELGQIRNSNAPMLAAQCRRLGVPVRQLPIVGDDPRATGSAVGKGLEEVDILILTGGVSMGKHDYVPEILKDAGVKIVFHKVAVKPGKPVLFGQIAEKLVFGLPGNPVSSFVTFELFVRPAIRRWQGLKEEFLPEVMAVAATPFRNMSGRDFYAPGLASPGSKSLMVDAVRTRGSADLAAFSQANCLVKLPANCGQVKEGSLLKTLLLTGLS